MEVIASFQCQLSDMDGGVTTAALNEDGESGTEKEQRKQGWEINEEDMGEQTCLVVMKQTFSLLCVVWCV